MEKLPTIWQYLVDSISKSRIDAAKTSTDKDFVIRQMSRYSWLRESEVVFTVPVKRPNGKYATTMTSESRGFKLDCVFATGKLETMLIPQATQVETLDEIKTINAIGFYYIKETKELVLGISENPNIWESLKTTGYEFDPSMYIANQQFVSQDGADRFNGDVIIDHPIVSGKIFLLTVGVQQKPATEPKVEVKTPEVKPEEKPVEGTEGAVPVTPVEDPKKNTNTNQTTNKNKK